MTISVGSDHGGFERKCQIISYLKEEGYEVLDRGCYDLTSVDYPVYAKKVALDIQKQQATFGILICTTGIGMSISANKFKGIRAALVTNLESAHLTREHNDSNILCLGAKFTNETDAKLYVKAFLEQPFAHGRHERRVHLIEMQEEETWEN